MRILFIGNSHTYFNDMPAIVSRLAGDDGIDCQVTMIAHGGWYLAQHVEEPEVSFNIRCGHYDYVVLQEYSHPFGPAEMYYEAVRLLVQWIREAGSTPVIYMTWSKKDEPEKQAEITAAALQISAETDSLLAPVGDLWQKYRAENPSVEMYWEDGAHASPAGSRFAAEQIWKVILADIRSHTASDEYRGAAQNDGLPEVGPMDERLAELREISRLVDEYFLDEL